MSTENTPLRFPPAKQCIYCGKTDGNLTDEHIIPLSLGGRYILPKATCQTCQNYTSKMELAVARHYLGVPRVVAGIRSRRPNKRPSKVKIGLTRFDGTKFNLMVPLEKAPLLHYVPFFKPTLIAEFQEPDILSNPNWFPFVHKENDARMNALRVEHSVNHVQYSSNKFPFDPLPRMLWKIATGFFWVWARSALLQSNCQSMALGKSPVNRRNDPSDESAPLYCMNLFSRPRVYLVLGLVGASVYTLAEENHEHVYCEIGIAETLSFPIYVCRIPNPSKQAIGPVAIDPGVKEALEIDHKELHERFIFIPSKECLDSFKELTGSYWIR